MIEMIVSGGQCGADLGGIKTAKMFGIPTSGWIPKGFKTLDGPRPEYAKLYGLAEHGSDGYPPRTFCNVRDSDGTMRFAADWKSPGELCTRKAIDYYKRPFFDVDLLNLDPESIKKAIDWLNDHDILVLNIAGNTEKTHKTAELKTTMYLTKLFERLGLERV